MHVAAILDPTVGNARIHTWSDGFNWNDVLDIFRKISPEKEFPMNFDGMGTIVATVDDRRGRELLKRWAGRDEWIGLEEGVTETVKGKWPVALGAFK